MRDRSVYDLGGSHDLLVVASLALDAATALPNWRIFTPGEVIPHDAAPIAGILSAGDDRRILDQAGFRGLPIIHIADAAALPLSLAGLLANRLQETWRDAAEARHAAALLRREGEEQVRRLRMLENFAHALGGPRYLEALHWTPTFRFLELSGAVIQRFPLDTLTLTAIDLWVPEAEPEAAAAMFLELLDAAGKPIAQLTPERAAPPTSSAWMRFSAPAPIGGPVQDTVVRVSVPPGRTITIGLTSPVPDQRFAISLDGSPVAEGSLAARIWRADYLAPLPPANPRLNEVAGLTRSRRISLEDLGRPELLSTPAQAQDYVAAEFWARENAVFVHPSAQGPVCAILRNLDISQAVSVSTLVNVAHREAPVLGFAVGICPRGMATAENWQDHIGPYVFLPPGGWGECHHIPQIKPRTRCDVLLSTMVAGTGSNDNSWGLFHSLRVASEL